MSNVCFDLSDLIVPAFDANAKTRAVNVDIHPGQVELLDYFAGSTQLGFGNRENVIRWSIAWGTHTLLAPLPRGFALLEAKINILHYERFQRQKDCLGISVQKYLSAGQKENARQLIAFAYEEYSRIPYTYWRRLWLSTLEPAIAMLQKHGIRFSPTAARD
jgi:hypothetical protein